jgi:hypothetical protein
MQFSEFKLKQEMNWNALFVWMFRHKEFQFFPVWNITCSAQIAQNRFFNPVQCADKTSDKLRQPGTDWLKK